MGHRRVGIDSDPQEGGKPWSEDDRALSMNPARGERFWQYGKPTLDPGGLSYTSGRVRSFLERPVVFQTCAIPTCVFSQHKSLGRSSGEPAGSKKERRQRRLQRRQRGGACSQAGRQEAVFPPSAIAAPFIGTTRTFAFLRIANFRPLLRVANVCCLRTAGQISPGNGGSPHQRIFGRSSPSLISPAPRTLLSIGLSSVLLVDFLDGLFQELKLLSAGSWRT